MAVPLFLSVTIPGRLSIQTNETLVVFQSEYLVVSNHLKLASTAAGVFFTNRWEILLPVLLGHFSYECFAGMWPIGAVLGGGAWCRLAGWWPPLLP